MSLLPLLHMSLTTSVTSTVIPMPCLLSRVMYLSVGLHRMTRTMRLLDTVKLGSVAPKMSCQARIRRSRTKGCSLKSPPWVFTVDLKGSTTFVVRSVLCIQTSHLPHLIKDARMGSTLMKTSSWWCMSTQGAHHASSMEYFSFGFYVGWDCDHGVNKLHIMY